jgi:hypothetical protein
MTQSARPQRSLSGLAGRVRGCPPARVGQGGMRMRLAGCRKTGVLRQPASGTRRYRRFSIGQRLKNKRRKQKTYFCFPR